jgi:hypothetical protein
MKTKIRGKIIRILSPSVVVINLGRIHGVAERSIFSILGEPEMITDPFTHEELGLVTVVKGRVRATSVSEKFTIATSKWRTYASWFEPEVEVLDEEVNDLRVNPSDITPWKAVSKDYVRVGDEVEVTVDEAVKKGSPSEDKNETKQDSDS